jgi:hypothetical protein
VRKAMQERRGEIKTLWHAERSNYHQLDLVIQLKKDAEEVKNIFQETAKEQKLTMDILELDKEEAEVYAGDERSAQEIRNEAFMDLDMRRLKIIKSEKKGDSSEDESDTAEYNDANSGDEDVKIDWTKKFHTKQRKTTAWDVIASGEYRVSNYFDANAPKKDKKILDSVLVFDGKDITMYKAWKESVSMAICANMSLPFDEKLFKLRSELKGVPHGYVETYQLSGINFSKALRELDSKYQDNSDDQNALFEKLSLGKTIDLYNHDSIQEVLLTIRKIENHCGSNKRNKAGEISMYTNIKKTTNTTVAIRLFCDIRQEKKPSLALFKMWVADQCDALQAN